MNKAQEKLLRLLDEVSEVCKENGIPMFLFSNTALSAYRIEGFEAARYEVNVAMLWKDAVRFLKIMEQKQPAGRKMESLFSNPDFGNIAFRYVDANTTHINKDYHIRARELGLSLNILPLLSLECDTLQAVRFKDRVRENPLKAIEEKRARDKRRKRVIPMREAISQLKMGEPLGAEGRNRLLECIDELQQDATLDDTLYFRRFSTLKKVEFPKGIFRETMNVKFEGRTFKIPADFDGFFGAQFKHWEDKKIRTVGGIPRVEMLDEDMPYKKTIAFLKENGMEEYLDKRMSFHPSDELKECNDIIDHSWELVLRTAARINMWDQYMPLKTQIKELHEQENWDELAEILADYDEVMRTAEKSKMTVYFDKDIFDIYCQMRERNGDEGIREKLWERIPEEHLQPVYID